MQFMSFTAQDTHQVANRSANSSTTHTLIYRGATYQVPQQRINRTDSPVSSSATHTLIYRGVTYQVPQQRVNRTVQAQVRFAQLVGKRLIYRGATYEIGQP